MHGQINRCSLCKSDEIICFLDLGLQPLANKYPQKKEFENEDFFPLKIMFCKDCKNVQLGHIISRDRMFQDYYYLSSVNKGLVRYFESLANTIKDSEFVIDIGSNDGILLKPLKGLGVKCLGVDPSINVGKIANDAGLDTIVSFFDEKCVERILKEFGKSDTVVCSSTFTHLENPHNFIKNVKKIMREDGKLIIEVEYIGNFLKNVHFERFYLDRTFYYSLTSLKNLFRNYNMSIYDVEEIEPHGGSMKVTIINESQNKPPTKNVIDWLEREKEEINEVKLLDFKDIVDKNVNDLKNKLLDYKTKGMKVCGYGAPARVSTICNYGEIDDTLIKFTVDDSPLKCNKYTPGTHIPIKSKEHLEKYNPDIIVMFAYEYLGDIKTKLSKNYKFLLPIPPKEII